MDLFEHLCAIDRLCEERQIPVKTALRIYFRGKGVSKEQRTRIVEMAYKKARWRALFDYIGDDVISPCDYINNEDIPLHIRMSFPKEYCDLLVETFGEQKAKKIGMFSNEPPPYTIRVNTEKISRDELIEKWQRRFSVRATTHSKEGIFFKERVDFFTLPEFKAGYFELQDESSQLVTALMTVQPGESVLDYCAGAGGKSLAIAPLMKQQGNLYLYDNRRYILKKAVQRLDRAGIMNYSVVSRRDLASLKKEMDWILLDVPCSGSGALRRNPDMKWRFKKEEFEKVQVQQREIFAKAIPYLKERGKIVYMTCSLFPQENEEQIEYFCKTHKCCHIASLVRPTGGDKLYGAVLRYP